MATYNAISAQIEGKQREEMELRARLAAVDATMRDTVERNYDLHRILRESLEMLLSLPEERRTMDQLLTFLHPKMAAVEQDAMMNYDGVLGARDAVMEGGQAVSLTPEKKQDLRREFRETVQKTIRTFMDRIQPSSLDLLPAYIETCRANERQALQLYDGMLEGKTALTLQMEAVQGIQAGLLAQRRVLFSPPRDRWNAAQSGDLSYLKGVYRDSLAKYVFVQEQDSEGQTMLHRACQGHHTHVVLWLLEREALQSKNREGYFPLHLAAMAGDEQAVKALLRYKAAINQRGPYGRTPLQVAAFKGKASVVTHLLQNRGDPRLATDPDDGEKTPLHDAVLQNHPLVVQALAQAPTVQALLSARDSRGHTPSFYAFTDGFVEVAAIFVGVGSWKLPSPGDPDFVMFQKAPRDNKAALQKMLQTLPNCPSLEAWDAT